MNETPPDFEALLMGVSFRPIEAKAIVKDLEDGTSLILQREPTNKYDVNAIQVLSNDENPIEPNCFLGYVAKETACDLAPWMDQGWHFTCVMNGRYSESKIILDIRPILPESNDAMVDESADAD